MSLERETVRKEDRLRACAGVCVHPHVAVYCVVFCVCSEEDQMDKPPEFIDSVPSSPLPGTTPHYITTSYTFVCFLAHCVFGMTVCERYQGIC